MGGRLLVWNSWGLFGLVPVIVCTAMGAFVFATRPDRKQNRRLAVFLVTDGILTFAGPAGAAFAGSDATARIFFTVHLAALFLVLPIMLRFLATIDTPAAKPITTRIGAIVPWLFAAAELALFIARPDLFAPALTQAGLKSDHLSKREHGRDRDNQEHKQWARQGGAPEIAHGLRHPDALEPCGDDRRAATRVGGRQILDPEEIQRDRRAQEEDQSDTRPDREEGEHPVAGKCPAIDGASR